MAICYVTRKTTRFYRATTGTGADYVLIFGDEVDSTGPAANGRVPVLFRGRPGFVDEAALGQNAALEVYFIDVGQGDSAFIVTPGRKTILVDGGVNHQALGFLTWKYRLDLPASPDLVLDLMVVSHADADHLAGLVPIVQHPKIQVRRIAHSGIATFRSGVFATPLGDQVLVDGRRCLVTRHDAVGELANLSLSRGFGAWRDVVAAEAGVAYGAVDTSTGQVDVGDPAVSVDVLGPRSIAGQPGQPDVFPWFGDPAHTINGHSVVLRLTHGDVHTLFSGDVNIDGSIHLLEDPTVAQRLDAHVLKAPHHGSHEFHRPFLEAVRPQIAVISSGDEPDHGHPRAVFIGAMGNAMRSSEPLIFSTEIAAEFVELNERPVAGDAATLAGVDASAPGGPAELRRVFKKRLHGMINVRTDGRTLYAARRVATAYMWESYGPIEPLPRWQV